MQRSPVLRRQLTAWTGLILGLFLSSGCFYLPRSRRIGAQYYFMDIPVCAHGVDQSGYASESDNKPSAPVTDQTIIDCKVTVVNMLRDRMNSARLARTGGGFIQVVTAAASAMFTGTTGASALATSTILSGTSAIIPELSNVFEAKERAEVYSKGVEMIEDAYAQYLEDITTAKEEPSPPSCSPCRSPIGETLSPAAAVLYGKIGGALHVVEKGLAGQLPTLEELQKASPAPLDIATRFITLEENSPPYEIRVTRGGPLISSTSNRPNIAAVEIQEDANTAKITPAAKVTKEEEANILLRNGGGGITTLKVHVTPKATPAPGS